MDEPEFFNIVGTESNPFRVGWDETLFDDYVMCLNCSYRMTIGGRGGSHLQNTRDALIQLMQHCQRKKCPLSMNPEDIDALLAP